MLTPTGPTSQPLRAPKNVPAAVRAPLRESGPDSGRSARPPAAPKPAAAPVEPFPRGADARPVRIGRGHEQHALFAYQQHTREPEPQVRHVDEYV